MYWWFANFTFWNSVLGVAACTSFLVLVECEASSWLYCFQEAELWAFSCHFTWERSISGFWVVCTNFLVRVRSPCPLSSFPGLTGYPKSCEGFSLALHGNQVNWSRLRWKRWFWLCHCEPSQGAITWPLFDMALCFPIGSERKILQMAAREHREIRHVEQTKKMIAFVTRKTLFG